MKLINSYIAKKFLFKFLQIVIGFSLIIFFINFLDSLDKVKGSNAPFHIAIAIAFLRIPDSLNDVIVSLVLISGIISFFSLSSRSEITIIKVSGLQLWQILQPMVIAAFALGIFWVVIFDPLSIKMSRKFDNLEGKYLKHELREVAIAPQSGVWLKQDNTEKRGEEIVIQAKRVYQEMLELDDVTVWFFNKDGEFYKKIDAKRMLMQEDSWLLNDIIINDLEFLNKPMDRLVLPTNLKADFIMKKIVNNFQNVKLFSIFELPSLIKDLQDSGFDSTKFKVYLHSLLSKPLMFVAMVMIACYFGLNHIRNQNSVFMVFIGIVVGLVLYIISSVMSAFGFSGLIPVFTSTWLMAIICLSIGILLIYRKENLA